MTTIDKTNQYNELFDWYEVLLTDKQREVFEMYYKDNFSLAEISQEMDVSRAAVSDLLKRVCKILEDYEKKLKLVQKYHTRAQIYGKIKELQIDVVNRFVEQLEDYE